MPGVMANADNDGNVVPQRDPSPEQQRHWGCWSKLWCLGSSRKRGMRVVPARQEGGGAANGGWGATNGGAASSAAAGNQFVGLSPSLLAPPSSPASFANSGNPSTVQSPAGFTVSLCVPPATACSPAFDSTATMFTIGPYAHETTLVTPPAFSTFTTAPSTAPFTPPPELAHLTTPSSPDVPFAQLLTSLKNSTSPFASPDYVTRGGRYHLYPESPLTSLISPASGVSESGPPSPLPELEFPAAAATAAAAAAKAAFSRGRRLGHETPQSLDSNNHSRELEPIRILSPPEYEGRWCSRMMDTSGCTTPTDAAAAAATTSAASLVEQIEEHHRRSFSLHVRNGVLDTAELGKDESSQDAVVESSKRGFLSAQISDHCEDDDAASGKSESCHRLGDEASSSAALVVADQSSQQRQQGEEEEGHVIDEQEKPKPAARLGQEQAVLARELESSSSSPRSNSGMIFLELEITSDELVKLSMSSRNGCHGIRNNCFSKSSWEESDLECMERSVHQQY